MHLFHKLFGRRQSAAFSAPGLSSASHGTTAREGDTILDLNKVFPRIKGIFTPGAIDAARSPGPPDSPCPPDSPGPANSSDSPNSTDSPWLLSDPGNSKWQLSREDSPIYETFTKGLGIFYALDRGNHYQLLQNRHLPGNITREDLHEAALRNLTLEVGDRTQISGDPANVMMLINGGNFEAAMLLSDNVWDSLEEYFPHGICVAVPAHDLLFIAGKNNPAGRERLRQLVRRYFDEQQTPGLLVRHIYTRENNSWQWVETA